MITSSVRRYGLFLALTGVLAVAGCSNSNVGKDGFPAPQPEPAAAKAASQAEMNNAQTLSEAAPLQAAAAKAKVPGAQGSKP
jgi:hypothetical protein